MDATNLKLERETCSRCGGSGQYSYCQTYGTRCFKCAGKKEVLTKRGAAAAAYLARLRSRRADQLKPGDRVREIGIEVGGAVAIKGGWATVVSVTPDTESAHGIPDGSGGWNFVPTGGFVIETDKMRHLAVRPDSLYEVLLSREQQLATLQQAVAYQDSLTKAGKPRK